MSKKANLASYDHDLEFWKTIGYHLVEKNKVRGGSGSKEVSMYPSEASAIARDADNNPVHLGGCLRKSWWRNKEQRAKRDQPYQTNLVDEIVAQPFDAETLIKFMISSGAERDITEAAQSADFYADNSRRFKVRWDVNEDGVDYGEALVSGEVDLVVHMPDNPDLRVGIEVKSFSGYKGTREILGVESKKGGWIVQPSPKYDNLLQTVLYTYIFCVANPEYKYFKVVYISREDGKYIEFNVDLVKVEVDGVDKHQVYLNGEPYEYTLYAEDIIDRYTALHKYIVKDELPPRDFDLKYSDEKIAELAKKGELSKKDAELYAKGKPVEKGDWRCRYCAYSHMCYYKGEVIDYTLSDEEFNSRYS